MASICTVTSHLAYQYTLVPFPPSKVTDYYLPVRDPEKRFADMAGVASFCTLNLLLSIIQCVAVDLIVAQFITGYSVIIIAISVNILIIYTSLVPSTPTTYGGQLPPGEGPGEEIGEDGGDRGGLPLHGHQPLGISIHFSAFHS
jgi:hypothetical protein